MNNTEASITVLYINTRGQTKFSVQKQLCIQDLCIKLKCDIVHLQETDIDENAFEHCWATSMSQPDLSLKKVTTKILQLNCLRNG